MENKVTEWHFFVYRETGISYENCQRNILLLILKIF